MEVVKFRCPHCDTVVDVESVAIGEVVTCPNPDCGMPFEAEPPEARPLDPPEQGRRVDETHPKADENVESDLHVRHPAMLRWKPLRFLGLSLLAIAGAVAVVAAMLEFVVAPLTASLQMIAGGIALVVAGVMLFAWWVDVMQRTLTVTSARTIWRKGIFNKQTTEVLHEDVRNLQMDQTFAERIFNVGDIAVSSSGQDVLEIVAEGIPRPQEIVETIRKYQRVNA